jgi:chromosome segregation ATPase
MNQPINDELQELKRRVARLERYTEPIQITRLEIESGSLYRKLDDAQETCNAVETKIDGVRGDVFQIRESQVDLRDRLVEHGQRLESIEQKQDTHTEILGQLMNFGETTATKDDIARLDEKLDLILKLLQKE